MPDTKLSALAPLATVANEDEFYVVDKSDTSMAASGTSKRVTAAALLATTISTKTADHTLALADAGTILPMNSASAQAFTVPPNSSVAFPIGSQIGLMRYGAGSVTITPGAGVTIPNAIEPAGTASRTITGQMLSVVLLKTGTDEWILEGSIA